MALVQSLADVHFLPSVHLPQVPPQSTSVSTPFCTLSEHDAVWHLSGDPEHTRLTQSLATTQVLVAAQVGHTPPPQSMSVSLPFLTTSEQLGSWQMLAMHTPL